MGQTTGILHSMDPRWRPVSIEIMVTCIVLIGVFQLHLISMDVTNLVTQIVLLIFVAEFVRILYLFNKLKNEGVNIAAQAYRSPLADSLGTRTGNAYAAFSKWRMYLIGIVIAAILVFCFLSRLSIF